jgi:hypothetical protein
MSATQFVPWAAGQKITATELANMQPFFAIKPSLQAVTSSTVLVDDTDLQCVIAVSSGTFVFDLFLNYFGGTIGSSDLKMTMQYTGTTSSAIWGVHGISTAATNQLGAAATSLGSTAAIGTSGGTFFTAFIGGSLVISSAGTLKLQWAQNTSSATATTMRQNSWMRVQQIA